eukprot:1971881-Prymnesium_polylepis.1
MPRRERFLTTGHKPGQRRTPARAAAPRARRAAAGPLVAPFPTRPYLRVRKQRTIQSPPGLAAG